MKDFWNKRKERREKLRFANRLEKWLEKEEKKGDYVDDGKGEEHGYIIKDKRDKSRDKKDRELIE